MCTMISFSQLIIWIYAEKKSTLKKNLRWKTKSALKKKICVEFSLFQVFILFDRQIKRKKSKKLHFRSNRSDRQFIRARGSRFQPGSFYSSLTPRPHAHWFSKMCVNDVMKRAANQRPHSWFQPAHLFTPPLPFSLPLCLLAGRSKIYIHRTQKVHGGHFYPQLVIFLQFFSPFPISFSARVVHQPTQTIFNTTVSVFRMGRPQPGI